MLKGRPAKGTPYEIFAGWLDYSMKQARAFSPLARPPPQPQANSPGSQATGPQPRLKPVRVYLAALIHRTAQQIRQIPLQPFSEQRFKELFDNLFKVIAHFKRQLVCIRLRARHHWRCRRHNTAPGREHRQTIPIGDGWQLPSPRPRDLSRCLTGDLRPRLPARHPMMLGKAAHLRLRPGKRMLARCLTNMPHTQARIRLRERLPHGIFTLTAHIMPWLSPHFTTWLDALVRQMRLPHASSRCLPHPAHRRLSHSIHGMRLWLPFRLRLASWALMRRHTLR